MKHKSNVIYPTVAFLLVLGLWQLLCVLKIVPEFMLPPPLTVAGALVKDLPVLSEHIRITVLEGISGLIISVAVSFFLAVVMDSISPVKKAFYPLIVLSQTVPVIAIAPLLVLWLGYGISPRIVLVTVMCFFPITVGLLDGFSRCDTDCINLLRTMNAKRHQIFFHAKLPFAMPYFFSALKISASYAVVGAVISEWMGGNTGLGVYMIRVRKSYSFDKMFAVIIVIMILSLMLMLAVELLKKIFIRKGL